MLSIKPPACRDLVKPRLNAYHHCPGDRPFRKPGGSTGASSPMHVLPLD